ncbi:MAG: bifunctional 4-hydroxy-2-oxoglutarate aldolase/2-dehydro-3-deoxy-phosphogluconate aldolase [Bacteroidota bacterium]
MARFTRIQVATQLAESGILPLFYHPDLELCQQVVTACYEGGIRALEFTNRGDFAHEVFGELNKYCAKELPEMMLGIGSVYDAGTTSLFLQLGANFIVSPVMNPEMAKVCNRRKVMWSPGCGTLSEISQAEELGAEIVKIFPAPAVGGPGFIKAVKGPQPWTSIMPTGGVAPTRENLTTWFDAGATCVGMGSKLITKDILARMAFDELANKVRDALALAKEIRG